MLHYAITPGTLDFARDAGATARLAERCGELARDGVDFILVREKQLAAGELAGLSRLVLASVRGSATKVLIARRLDVALAVGADGVHLAGSPGELRPGQAHQLMPGAFVSVSCHSLEEVRRARQDGASAVLFGPVFGKTVDGVEVVRGVGSDRLRAACVAAEGMPVFALGGVTERNATECAGVGASGVAAIRMFFG